MFNRAILLFASALAAAVTGCVATGPLFSPPTSGVDDREVAGDLPENDRWPIRLVSFPSIEIMPLWPSEEEAAQTSRTIVAPLAAGADAVKRGAGQVQQGFVELGHGTRRAVNTTTHWLSRPLVAVRGTPGQPSLLGRMFAPEPVNDGPLTTREFFAQERVR